MQDKKKILIAESEKASLSREVLSLLLKSWDYDFIFVDTAAKLNETIKHYLPDIIIVDSDLSDADGLSICKNLKADFLTSHIPLILLIEKKRIRRKMLDIPQGVDDYILKPPDPIDLEIRIEMAARRSEHQIQTSYLTRLPGTTAAERVIKFRMHQKSPFSVLYIDIDNFKIFNDKYGYSRGDIVIKQVSHIISTTAKKFGNKDDFVGHIGGDDFVVISAPDKEKAIAEDIIHRFDLVIPYHYTEIDRKRGYFVAIGRSGKKEKAALMTVSIAIVNNLIHQYEHIFELTHLLAEIKKYLKGMSGSKFLVNRRIKKEVVISHNLDLNEEEYKNIPHYEDKRYKPIGQLLLEEGLISEDKLYDALHQHFNTRLSIGQIFLKSGIINEETLNNILQKQNKTLDNYRK